MAVELKEAQEILLAHTKTVDTEYIDINNSYRRVLAESIISDIDFPPFRRSPLDGYAVRSEDVKFATKENPIKLTQIDYVAAGSVAKHKVTTGTACKIMTGAPLPEGADGIIRFEDTTSEGDNIYIQTGANAHLNVCKQGEEISLNEEILLPGTQMNMGTMGMCAVLGRKKLLAFKKPKVTLLATGTEILPIDKPLEDGKIRNSNSYMLSAQVIEAGGEPIFLGEAPDDVDKIAKKIEDHLDCDIFISTGGASVGDYDLIHEVYKKLGIKILFERVKIKPGMPVLAGVKDGKLFIGLSGNPAAASIAFEQIVRPVLSKLGGRAKWFRKAVYARMTTSFKKVSNAKRFIWAHCYQDSESRELWVDHLKLQGNGMLKSAMLANSLIFLDENSKPVEKGSLVRVYLLDGFTS